MKKKVLAAVCAVLALLLIYFVGTGFRKINSVYISDFSLSEDGGELTIRVGVASSAGFVRAVSPRREGDALLLDCFSAFGGVNGGLGAKHVFTLPLDASVTAIALCRDGNRYEVVLQKGEDGVWRRAKGQ